MPTFQPQGLRKFAVSRDRHALAAATGDMVALWDLHSGEVIREVPLCTRDYVQSMVFSPDGRMLLVVSANYGDEYHSSMQCFDVATGILKKQLNGQFEKAIFNQDGTLVAAGSNDRSLTIWDSRDWMVVKRLYMQSGVRDLAFSPDGMKLAWICFKDKLVDNNAPANSGNRIIAVGEVTLWDYTTNRRITLEDDQLHPLANLLFSPDGRWVAAEKTPSSRDGDVVHEVLLWDATTGKRQMTLLPPGDYSDQLHLLFTPDSRHLFGERKGYLFTWDIASGKQSPEVKVSSSECPNEIQLTADGKTLVTGGFQEGINIWDTRPVLMGTTPAEYASLNYFRKGAWLAITSEGYFVCSSTASKAIGWRFQGKLYPYEKFEKEYHRPDLLRKALAVFGR